MPQSPVPAIIGELSERLLALPPDQAWSASMSAEEAMMRVRYSIIARLWREGKSQAACAREIGISQSLYSVTLMRARKLLGDVSVPRRKAQGLRRPRFTVDAALATLHKAGDSVSLSFADARNSQSVYQAARRRGLSVSISTQSDHVLVSVKAQSPR